MLRGLIKKSILIFIGAFFLSLSMQSEAYSFTNIKYDTNFYCADNAVAPLDSVMDLVQDQLTELLEGEQLLP